MNTPIITTARRSFGPLALLVALTLGGLAHAADANVEQRLRGELDAVMT